MAYTFKFLTEDQKTKIKSAAVAVPTAPVITDALRAAWEADLLTHMEKVKVAKAEDKGAHNAAIATLEAALTATP